MKFDFDIQNIHEAEGLAISLVGMTIVFAGLVCMSLYIIYMPKILLLWDRILGKKVSGETDADLSETEDTEKEKEIMAAITMVLEMALDEDDGSAMQRITIRRSGSETIWRQAGQMRSLSSNLKR